MGAESSWNGRRHISGAVRDFRPETFLKSAVKEKSGIDQRGDRRVPYPRTVLEANGGSRGDRCRTIAGDTQCSTYSSAVSSHISRQEDQTPHAIQKNNRVSRSWTFGKPDFNKLIESKASDQPVGVLAWACLYLVIAIVPTPQRVTPNTRPALGPGAATGSIPNFGADAENTPDPFIQSLLSFMNEVLINRVPFHQLLKRKIRSSGRGFAFRFRDSLRSAQSGGANGRAGKARSSQSIWRAGWARRPSKSWSPSR